MAAAQATAGEKEKGKARLTSARSPTQEAQPNSRPRASPAAAKNLFQAPQQAPTAPKPAAAAQPRAAPEGEHIGDEDEDRRVFSTPADGAPAIPARFATSDDLSFSYRAGHLEGRMGKDFAKVFNKELYDRSAFFEGFSDGVAVIEAAKKTAVVVTPELWEVRDAGSSAQSFKREKSALRSPWLRLGLKITACDFEAILLYLPRLAAGPHRAREEGRL